MTNLDDQILTCWCGAKGTYNELFDGTVFKQTCSGLGTLHCHCGGDLCVCHNHGEVECPGCENCKTNDSIDNGFED